MPSPRFPPTSRYGGTHGPIPVASSPTGVVRVSTTLRRAEAARLRCAGKSFRAIGEALGISAMAARKLVLGALEDVTFEAADILRSLECERLDALQDAVWDAAMAGDTKAVTAVLRVMDMRAKLMGTYAPTVVRAEVFTGDVIEAEVERLERLALAAGRADADHGPSSGGARRVDSEQRET